MSIHVTDFKWEKGKNDLQYIKLLEKTLENEKVITAKSVAKIRTLSDEKKELRANVIDEFEQRLKKICAERPLGTDREKWIPLYVHEDGTWHSLIDDVVAQMKGEKE